MQKQPPNVEVPRGFAVATPQANAYPPHGGPMHKIKHIRPVLARHCLDFERFLRRLRSTQLLSDRRCLRSPRDRTYRTAPLPGRIRGCRPRIHHRGGLDARKVAATMAQWITGYGPGRILKPAWAFEVATRFGEHFVNRERFEKVLGRLTVSVTEQAPLTNHLISRFSSESALSEALVASCFIPYPGQWNINCGNFQGHGWWLYQQSTIN